MKILTAFALASLLAGTHSAGAEGILPANSGLALYVEPLNPAEYPEDARRNHAALTVNDLGSVPRLVAGRTLPKSDDELSDSVLGEVYRPFIDMTKDAFLTHALKYAAARNLIVHNVGGYCPGSAGCGSLPEASIKLIEKYVPRAFTGFDIGEQDGRFNFTYKQIIDPYVQNRVCQYLSSQPYFDRVAEDQGNWCSLLSVLWYWHYPIKEGYISLAGA